MKQNQSGDAPQKKKKSGLTTFLIFIVMLLGWGIIFYPTFSDWWNSFHQTRAIATYSAAVEETDTGLIEKMLEDARNYNKQLLTKDNRYHMDEEEQEEYESLLNLSGNGIIGYIQISCIDVNLPIYHGTEENILQIAIGHIEGSSLPVGGENTHTVLSGHRGLPSARLFSDLDKMKEGDTFTITVLNQTITYEVDQIKVVEPGDTTDINIAAGEDYCTLITCTPYGINTHRLLVRGHRIENISGEVVILPGAEEIPLYIVIPAIVIPLMFLELILLLIYYRRGQKTLSRFESEKLLEKLQGRIRAVPQGSTREILKKQRK